jgi:RimJ/RimL family protein N-acetyltransferase
LSAPDIALTPYSGEAILGDPALVGEFAEDLAAMVGEAETAPWCSYLALRDGEAVGMGGFKGEPDDDAVVEIGYLTFIPSQGTGVATALAGMLVDIAWKNEVVLVLAHTSPEHSPSTRVLAANGFTKTAEVEDPEDGPVWRWEKWK